MWLEAECWQSQLHELLAEYWALVVRILVVVVVEEAKGQE